MTRMATGVAIALTGLAAGWLGSTLVRSHADATLRATASAAPSQAAFAARAGAIVIDGETDEPWWPRATFAGAFVDGAGEGARPYSDIRVARDEKNVYLALYSADEDVRARDTMHVELGAVAFDAHPTGTLDGAPEGAKAAAECDGTLDDSRDDDEEWVVEVAIPIERVEPSASARGSVPLLARRCDTLKDASVRCSELRRTLALR